MSLARYEPYLPWEVAHCLRFCQFRCIQKVDFVALITSSKEAHLDAAKLAAEYATDFAEIAALMTRLDATRPKPVFTSIGVSPTITATLKEAGLVLNVATVRMCQMKVVEVERKNMKGETEIVSLLVLEWPEGTVHGSSRFHNYNDQCESCGHRIKNVFNWIPLLIDDAAGVPHSMWVGRDCSERIFGICVKGDVELAEGQTRCATGGARLA